MYLFQHPPIRHDRVIKYQKNRDSVFYWGKCFLLLFKAAQPCLAYDAWRFCPSGSKMTNFLSRLIRVKYRCIWNPAFEFTAVPAASWASVTSFSAQLSSFSTNTFHQNAPLSPQSDYCPRTSVSALLTHLPQLPSSVPPTFTSLHLLL